MTAQGGRISSTARVGAGCQLGINIVVAENVQIGDGCALGHNVVVHAGTVLGAGVTVEDNAVLGRQPRPSPTSTVKIYEPLPGLVLGDGCSVGTGAVVYAGTRIGHQTMTQTRPKRGGCG